MTTLALCNVVKSYGNENVLEDINFEVDDGELIVIVGPSGCGKSSLLRMVAGLEEITAGEILINEKVINSVEPRDRDIAMVFQNYALYPHMTVYKNMAYGLKLRGIPRPEIETRVNHTATLLGLESLLDRKPAALSGGQRQRVAMGRAIVREPAIFLFDEPLSNLDATLRVRMRLEIKELQQRLGVTSLYVTHDQVEAMTLADRLVVLNEGQIEQIDTPLKIYQKPASVYVAGFIGTPAMNFLEGTVMPGSADRIRLGNGVILDLPGLGLQACGSINVSLGIRPDHIAPCSMEQADFICLVTAVETLGSETLAHCALNEPEAGEMPDADPGKPFIVKLNGNHQPKIHETLHLKVKIDEVHLFQTDTGLRINRT